MDYIITDLSQMDSINYNLLEDLDKIIDKYYDKIIQNPLQKQKIVNYDTLLENNSAKRIKYSKRPYPDVGKMLQINNLKLVKIVHKKYKNEFKNKIDSLLVDNLYKLNCSIKLRIIKYIIKHVCLPEIIIATRIKILNMLKV